MTRIPFADFRRAVEEQGALRGARVDNVYQCGPRLFLLRLSPDRRALVFDAERGRARAVVTESPPETPDGPPPLGAILRKALRGARLRDVNLLGKDRIAGYDFDAGGDVLRLVLEALPHPNLLLLDGAGVVLRVLDGEAAKRRGTPVGAIYRLPPAPRVPDEATLLPEPLPAAPFAANAALDALFRDQVAEDRQEESEDEIRRALDRLRRTREAVAKDLASLPDPAALRRAGETLLVHFPQLRAGMKDFQGVRLDPRLNPQENVERVFEEARKAERAKPALEERLRSLDDLARRIEAGEEPPSRVAGAAKRKGEKPPPRLPYRTFRSADGRRILVGKGGADNDELTLRIAGPHDLFLHVRGTPGSHVIVPLARGEAPPEQTLLDAATLAQHYSKSRSAAAVDVCFTPRKNVAKPAGAKPGLVQVRHERVLRLRREPERLARLLMTAGFDQ